MRLRPAARGPAVNAGSNRDGARAVSSTGSAALPARLPARTPEAVGLLDERFFLYTEDVDFCAAIRARGRQVLFTPAADVTHLRGRSRATAPARMNAAYRRSHLAFYEKHHPRWAPLLRSYLRLKGQTRPQRSYGATEVEGMSVRPRAPTVRWPRSLRPKCLEADKMPSACA